MIKIKRAYEEPDKGDGYRILVDRLWPRGMTNEKLKADLWLKEIAPTNELRRWFSHNPKKWPAFKKKYSMELEAYGELIAFLSKKAHSGTVTFLYAAKDTERNNAVALKEYFEKSRTKPS